jgi:hypothetical protein
MFWRFMRSALRAGQVPWAIEKAIQGEHLIRYTEEHAVRMADAAAEAARDTGSRLVAGGYLKADAGGVSPLPVLS